MEATHFLVSPRLTNAGFRHAFFTRLGGVSSGSFESLNFSASVGDTPENVHENFERASVLLGVTNASVCHLNQVHGKDWVALSNEAVRSTTEHLAGDAVISDCQHVACAVRTADCVPILVADLASGAVAAIHAGWRGLVAGVIPSALLALNRLSGGNARFLAAIGPHISVGAYEISEDVAAQLERAAPGLEAVDRASFAKPHVDLRKIAQAQLSAGGVLEVDRVGGCTFFEPDHFFSFRASGAASGRQLSAIVAREPR